MTDAPTETSGTAPFLEAERRALATLLPDLSDHLLAKPLLEHERRGSGIIDAFRASGAPALLVPSERGGLGADAVDAVRIQRAIGSLSPSLAVAATMHHFSMSTLIEYCLGGEAGELEWMLLQGIAEQRLLLASGAAEGVSSQPITNSTMTAIPGEDCYVINGRKKPCSLSSSMDILTATVVVTGDGANPEPAMALVPAESSGIERQPFWGTTVLDAAESEEVILTNVKVRRDLVLKNSDADPDGRYYESALLWFELLITASYLGATSALVDRVLISGKGDDAATVELVAEVESAFAGLELIASEMADGVRSSELLARLLLVRYAAHGAVGRVTARALETLGGIAFIGSPEIVHLATVPHALGFHPPTRRSGSGALRRYLAGEPLVLE